MARLIVTTLGSVIAIEIFRINLDALTERMKSVGDDYGKRLDDFEHQGASDLYSTCDIVEIHRPLIRPSWR